MVGRVHHTTIICTSEIQSPPIILYAVAKIKPAASKVGTVAGTALSMLCLYAIDRAARQALVPSICSTHQDFVWIQKSQASQCVFLCCNGFAVYRVHFFCRNGSSLERVVQAQNGTSLLNMKEAGRGHLQPWKRPSNAPYHGFARYGFAMEKCLANSLQLWTLYTKEMDRMNPMGLTLRPWLLLANTWFSSVARILFGV